MSVLVGSPDLSLGARVIVRFLLCLLGLCICCLILVPFFRLLFVGSLEVRLPRTLGILSWYLLGLGCIVRRGVFGGRIWLPCIVLLLTGWGIVGIALLPVLWLGMFLLIG